MNPRTKPAHALCVDEITCLDAVAGGKVPTEFVIFEKGVNDSTKGRWIFDDKAAKDVMGKYRAMSRRVSFDYDHAALRKDSLNPAETAKSAGTCLLEVRDGALWAVDCKFTPKAKAAIEDGEWPYFSPAFSHVGGRPTWVISIGLTQNPSLHNLDELATAASALADDLGLDFSDTGASAPDPSSLSAPVTDDTTALAASRSPLTSAPVKPADDRAAAASNPDTRREMARKAAAAWAVNNLGVNGPVGMPPDHPAVTAPLTFQYPNPAAAGNWLGCIEPDADSWIAFVTPAGKTALWDRRNDDGSVAGAPMLFQRDIATLLPDDEDAAKASITASVLAMTALHADLASAASDYVDACLDAELAALGVA